MTPQRTLVFLLEERSAEAMLEVIIPKLMLESFCWRYILFEGKEELDRDAGKRIRGYKDTNVAFLILRDKDSGDCIKIKQALLDKIPDDKHGITLVRIACCELESFYLGDLKAVEKGMQLKDIAKQQKKSKFREPDKRSNAKEELKKLTSGRYQPVAGSRAIAPYLDLEGGNRSLSFNALIEGIKKLAGQLANHSE